ncbi:MAG: ion transporter [Planctomycetota bacterium]|nr:MAG: ion transporter [Planctomycetota bacterium]
MKQRIYRLLELQEGFWGKAIQWFVTVAILLSALTFILETVPKFKDYKSFFRCSEFVFIGLFTIEYLLRLYSQPKRAKWALTNPFAIIDFFAIVPFYIELLLPFFVDARMLRLLRLIRVVARILRVGRHRDTIDVLVGVIRKTWKELTTGIILAVIVALIASTGIYYAEYVFIEDDIIRNDNFSDMAKCLWWSVVTLTTVGYGDVYPTTILGKIFATFVMLGGIAMIALPSGLIAGAFIEEIRERSGKR